MKSFSGGDRDSSEDARSEQPDMATIVYNLTIAWESQGRGNNSVRWIHCVQGFRQQPSLDSIVNQDIRREANLDGRCNLSFYVAVHVQS
jgi:hypothetical protein